MSLSIYCKPCFRGMYAISNSILSIKKGLYQIYNVSDLLLWVPRGKEENNLCKKCPVRASCTSLIASRSNFYDFKNF